MQISVVIPVYNATSYVEQAVRSALDEPRTGEVLLVEDGSPDGASLPTCERLARADERVRLFRHPNGANRGPGPSRNLGIVNATCDYLAFLDADDYYLPGRFATTEQVFQADPTAEAVYECTGTCFETERARQIWHEQNRPPVSCIEPGIAPEKLFESMLPVGKRGKCHMDGLTLKRHVADRLGLFVDLPVGEDTVFVMRLAACARWLPGKLDEPVALRRVHEGNRTTGHAKGGKTWAREGMQFWRARMAVWVEVFRWLARRNREEEKMCLVLGGIRQDSLNLVARERNALKRAVALGLCHAELVCRMPRLAGDRAFLHRFVRDVYQTLRKK